MIETDATIGELRIRRIRTTDSCVAWRLLCGLTPTRVCRHLLWPWSSFVKDLFFYFAGKMKGVLIKQRNIAPRFWDSKRNTFDRLLDKGTNRQISILCRLNRKSSILLWLLNWLNWGMNCWKIRYILTPFTNLKIIFDWKAFHDK